MAIFPKLTPAGGVESASAIDIEAWAVEQAAERLQAATISSPLPIRGTRVTLDIPLDEPLDATNTTSKPDPRQDTPSFPVFKKEAVHTVNKRQTPVRRDSLNRREALLKGKEGSRRRQRYENDRLLNNPYAQPPLPSDWEVRPTYPVHSVPYFLAPLWDAEYKYKASAHKKPTRPQDARAHGSLEEQAASRVPRELKAKLKRSRGAKGMLQDLEQEVRRFVESWEAEQREIAKKEEDEEEDLIDGDSEDEEIVFVGRNGAMSDERKAAREEEDAARRRDKLVFESLVDDNGAAFGRWLVHSIATYYGLETWSVTKGNPARREAYVGLKAGNESPTRANLPQPLWGLV